MPVHAAEETSQVRRQSDDADRRKFESHAVAGEGRFLTSREECTQKASPIVRVEPLQ